MEATQSKPSAINPKLVIPFVNSVRSVFTTMVGVPTTVDKPSLKPEPAPSFDVSGIIGFSGQVVGSVVVSFQKQAAIRLVEAFSGSNLSVEDPDFADAIGELTNMIAGAAKKDLGGLASITTPSVIIGAGHHIARLKDAPCLMIPVRTSVGDLAVEVCIKHVP